ncbi:MAG: hypothetical protein K6G88_09760 [Lachnospiraceae bacterium]|nr:hypothetical protein [Lachnospiraceae bacterium]
MRRNQDEVVECIDNDETASKIATLVKPQYLHILTSTKGMLKDSDDTNSVIEAVEGKI